MAGENTLGTALGRLVHSYQEGLEEAERFADAALDAWLARPDATVSIEATDLEVDGVVELSGQDVTGRWILPVFMAGLRELRLGPDTDASDFMRLAEELAGVDATTEAVEHLRDWLWMDGAEGFRIELESSFTDALEAAFVDPESAKQEIMAMRAEAAMALSPDSVAVASKDLDAAAVRDEFQLPLDALAETTSAGRWDVDARAREELARSCDSAAFWVKSQVDFGLAHPAMQPSIAPRKLSRTLIKHASEAVDPELLEVLADVTQRGDPFTAELTTVLDQEHLGDTIARTLRPDPAVLSSVRTLLEGTRSRLAQEVAHGLLDRAATEPALVGPTTELVTTLGLNRFWGQIDLDSLQAGSTGTLTRILPQCEVSPAIARELLRRPAVGGPLLGSLPGATLAKLSADVQKFLLEAPPEHAEPVVQALADQDDPQIAALLGEVLVKTEGKGWKKATLEKVMGALVAGGLAERHIVPLAHDRKADWPSRLTAFRALARDPDAFRAATRWRFGELFEPGDAKRWIKAARKAGGLPKLGKPKGGGLGWTLLLLVVAAVAVAGAYAAFVMNRDGLTPQQMIERIQGEIEARTGGGGEAPADATGEPATAAEEGS